MGNIKFWKQKKEGNCASIDNSQHAWEVYYYNTSLLAPRILGSLIGKCNKMGENCNISGEKRLADMLGFC